MHASVFGPQTEGKGGEDKPVEVLILKTQPSYALLKFREYTLVFLLCRIQDSEPTKENSILTLSVVSWSLSNIASREALFFQYQKDVILACCLDLRISEIVILA